MCAELAIPNGGVFVYVAKWVAVSNDQSHRNGVCRGTEPPNRMRDCCYVMKCVSHVTAAVFLRLLETR